jgi:hypothetical protein
VNLPNLQGVAFRPGLARTEWSATIRLTCGRNLQPHPQFLNSGLAPRMLSHFFGSPYPRPEWLRARSPGQLLPRCRPEPFELAFATQTIRMPFASEQQLAVAGPSWVTAGHCMRHSSNCLLPCRECHGSTFFRLPERITFHAHVPSK